MTLTPIVQLLRNNITPYAADESQKRITIARGEMEACDLPASVKIEQRKIIGRSVTVKSRRLYASARTQRATWPGCISTKPPA